MRQHLVNHVAKRRRMSYPKEDMTKPTQQLQLLADFVVSERAYQTTAPVGVVCRFWFWVVSSSTTYKPWIDGGVKPNFQLSIESGSGFEGAAIK